LNKIEHFSKDSCSIKAVGRFALRNRIDSPWIKGMAL
jgi:hypothetical protein